MVVDKGGLAYTIDVQSKLDGVAQFKAAIAEARATWAGFKSDLSTFKGSSQALRTESQKIIQSSQEAAKAYRVEGDASRTLEQRFNARRAAMAQLNAETRRQATAQASAQIENQRQYVNERRLATTLQKRQKAEKDVTKAIDKRGQAEERVSAAKARGIDDATRREVGIITADEKKRAVALDRVAKATERAALAEQKRAESEKLLGSRALKQNIIDRSKEQAQVEQQLQKVQDARAKSETAIERLRQREQEKGTNALTTQRIQAERRINGVLGDQEKILQNLATLQRKGVALSSLSDQQKTSLGLASKLPAGYFSGVGGSTGNVSLKDKIKDFLGLGKAAQAADGSVNRIAFTFRRLFGILAAFTIARNVIAGFGQIVKEMVSFNSTLEQAQLGIAGLLIAVGSITAATGQTVQGAEAFALAQKEARRQTQLLRVDALKTAATFEQLVQTYQVALAPGLQAGLDVDQIRQFTVRISQAAAAIGLSENQLAEEIRSILQGTIQARTTRIAVALGITNEDIRRAKETGTLVQFLSTKFQAFDIVGQETLNTFNAIWTNLRDGFSLVIGAGGLEFFEKLKGLLKDIQGLLITKDAAGILSPNPEAVSAIGEIGKGLSFALDQAKKLGESLSFDSLKDIGTIIGNGIATAASVLRGLVTGVVVAFKPLTILFRSLNTIFGNEAVVKLAATVAAILTTSLAIHLVWGGLLKIFTGIAEALKVIKALQLVFTGQAKLLSATMLASLGSFGLILAAVVAIGAAWLLFSPSKEMEKTVSATDQWGQIMEGITSVISTQSKALKDQSVTIKKLVDDLVKAKDSLAEVVATQGLDGPLAAQASIQIKSLIEQREKTKDLKREQEDILSQQRGLIANEIALNAEKKKSLSNDELKILDRSVDREKKIAALKNEQVRLNQELLLSDPATTDTKALKDRLAKIPDEISSIRQQISDDIAGSVIGPEVLTRFQKLYGLLRLQSGLNPLTEEQKNKIADAEKRIGELTVTTINLSTRGVALENQRKEIADSITEVKAKQEEIERKLLGIEAQRNAYAVSRLNLVKEAELKLTQGNVARQFAIGVSAAEKEVSLSLQTVELAQKKLQIDDTNRQHQLNYLQLQAAKELNRLSQQDVPVSIDTATAIKDIETIQDRIKKVKNDNSDVDNAEIASIQAASEKMFGVLQSASKFTNDSIQLRLYQTSGMIEHLKTLLNDPSLDQATRDRYLENLKTFELALDNIKEQGALSLANAAQLDAVYKSQQLDRLAEVQELTKARLEAAQKIREADSTAPFSTGIELFIESLRNMQAEAVLTAGKVRDVLVSAVTSFSEFASQAIVDAFDPTKDSSIKERFARFLQGIAQQIIQMLVQVATIKAVLGLTSLFGGGAADGGNVAAVAGIGLAEGGPIPHRKARGYAGGGIPDMPAPASIRPKGLDPRDTVPIWADPREWVIRASSVAKYGHNVMAAINQGLIDPMSLKALAGVKSPSSSWKYSKGPGFAAGGSISQSAKQSTSSATAPGVAVLVADDKTADRIFRSGKNAILAWMSENKTAIRTAINQ